MSRAKLIKEKIKYLEGNLHYEQQEGVHTYTECECQRKGTRTGSCYLCIQEQIDKLNSELKELKKKELKKKNKMEKEKNGENR